MEKAMKSQMESTGGIPRAGEVNEMANESANDIKPFTEEEKEIYNKTIERFLNIGITGKNRIIIEMAKEINYYRKKIQEMEAEKKSEMEMLLAGGPAISGVLRVDEPSVSLPIIDALPNDLRERMESISLDPDGIIFIYFREVNHGTDK